MWVPETEWPRDQDDEGELRRALDFVAARVAYFDERRPLYVARAPGRLDVMGGIADYSGSLVLEMPIAGATWVVAQASDDPEIVVHSDEIGALGGQPRVTIPLDAIVPERALDYPRARALLTGDPARAWAAYVAGALVILHAERAAPLQQGLRLLVWSEVPVGKGLSSSAALEVAALEVLAPLVGVALEDRELALLAQKIENFVVGAPCGVMDQMTAASGRRDHLLEILCQPAELVGQVPLPADLEVFGMDSGIRHAVSGADYGTVRAAAFMGYRILADAAGLAAKVVGPGRVTIDDPVFQGYLANVPASEWHSRYRAHVPERLSGRAFLDRYQGFTDGVTIVDPDRTYPVRAATEHGIEEHARVRQFRGLLATDPAVSQTRTLLGALMYASHASYSACGLGSEGTDRLVALVREAGPEAGLYGAKITGGGSGGTVAVLAARGSRAAAQSIVNRYRDESGRSSALFVGSSDGSRAFGVRKLIAQARGLD
jgi:galactokinase